MPKTYPVYLIAGFLDSGKSTFINGILSDGFAIEDRTQYACGARRGRQNMTKSIFAM